MIGGYNDIMITLSSTATLPVNPMYIETGLTLCISNNNSLNTQIYRLHDEYTMIKEYLKINTFENIDKLYLFEILFIFYLIFHSRFW